ncbi:hypothetical protein H0W32_03410 [Patescibacteria group bacterium]|nr:hypothetical protein [Patescibacteria group bacterium]
MNEQSIYTPIPKDGSSAVIPGESVQGANTKIGKTYVTGSVKNIQNNIVALETDEGVREFILPKNAYVMRNNIGISVSTLKQGDDVTIMFDEQGQVLSVESAPASTVQSPLLTNMKDIVVIGLTSILLAAVITQVITDKRKSFAYPETRVIGI